jgi:four helix bundle protein
MNNKDFGKRLEKRTKIFAVSIIRLFVTIPYSPEGKVIRNQLTKSGTSIGANYREANRARSTADFSNKIKICESEAGETMYWLEILEELNWIENENLKLIMAETNELISIFTSIGKKLKPELRTPNSKLQT